MANCYFPLNRGDKKGNAEKIHSFPEHEKSPELLNLMMDY
jgi:hypothetical protein